MKEQQTIDVTSLKMVFEELNKTLLQSSQYLDAFVANQNDAEAIQQAHTGFRQVAGIMAMLDLPCALALSENLAKLMQQLAEKATFSQDFAFKAAGHASVALTCYLEYILDTRKTCETLILPFLNELRSALREPLLLESQQAGLTKTDIPNISHTASKMTIPAKELLDLHKRMRALYQFGLLGLIHEESTKSKIQLMHQAMERLAKQTAVLPAGIFWRLAEAVLAAMYTDQLELTFTRKRVLASLDAVLRRAIASEHVPSEQDDALLLELFYLLQQAGFPTESAKAIQAQFSLPVMAYDDRYVQKQRAIMQGPSNATVKAMVSAILHDLSAIKNRLENFAEKLEPSHDFSELLTVLRRLRSVLKVVGAGQVSELLAGLCSEMQALTDEPDKEQLLSMADAVLHIESRLKGITRLQLVEEGDQSLPVIEKRQRLMTRSQLEEAESVMNEEALASLQLAKTAFNSFLESDFNPSFIDELLAQLQAVKGALDILNHSKASAVLVNIIGPLQSLGGADALTREAPLFQGVADALMALEYYLSEIQEGATAPSNVLALAETSIQQSLEKAAAH